MARDTGAAEIASKARGHAYTLFGALMRQGPTGALRDYVAGLPELASTLPDDEDEAAADHYEALHLAVHPFESLFTGETRIVGGPEADRVTETYRRGGFEPDDESPAPDHIGVELGYLGWLSSRETAAIRAGDAHGVDKLRGHQRTFLDAHLLRWLVPLTVALSRQPRVLYVVIARLALELAATQRAGLGDGPDGAATALSDVPDVLARDDTGLRDIAHWLLTPAFAGLHLGRHDIAALGRQLDLPRGFGDREQMLLNLMRTAADYDRIGDLADALGRLVAVWRCEYEARVDASPTLAVYIEPWRDRLDGTTRLLDRLRDATGTTD